ncbi:MAG: hypothetical protein QGG25_13340, partial [Phycisphaerae bacterium]|nr:hypothetical protein [Phycisphaerae bacterium]
RNFATNRYCANTNDHAAAKFTTTEAKAQTSLRIRPRGHHHHGYNHLYLQLLPIQHYRFIQHIHSPQRARAGRNL